MAGSVSFAKDGTIATITIENPGRLNALSMPMWLQLGEAFRKASADDALRCVILRGAGDAFAAGADIAEFENERYDLESAKKYGKAIHPSLEAVSNCPHPVIAQINGPCVGGGLEIAARADIRICSEDARFGIPVNRLGLVVAYDELKPLLEIVGPAAALEILLEGTIIDAARAEKIGLVNRVVADVESDVQATAKRIAAGAPLTARWHKKFVRRLLDGKPLTDADREENYACFGTEDFKIGYRAFLEKKKPEFKGR
jgi:enoyl-CoA hydratase